MSVENNTNVPAKTERYSWQEKANAATLYMVNGNMRLVSELTEIPYPTLVDWRKAEWWGTLIEELKSAKKAKMGAKMEQAVTTSLELIQDRLENGDFILNNKTGEIQRKPVALRDVAQVANSLLTRQLQIEEISNKLNHSENTMQDTLNMLAKEFQKFNRLQSNKQAETIEFKEVE
jgi:hypothetical protein